MKIENDLGRDDICQLVLRLAIPSMMPSSVVAVKAGEPPVDPLVIREGGDSSVFLFHRKFFILKTK